MTTFTLTGDKELARALKKLAEAPTSKALQATLDSAVEPVRDEWASNVDVDEGDYKRSIKVGRGRSFQSDEPEAFVGVDLSEDDRRRLEIYPKVEEFGGLNRSANPAGRRAIETKQREVRSRLKRGARRFLRQAARKARE